MSKADADNVFSDAKTIALAHAALEGDSARVRRLVSEGANPNAQGKDNVALLEWALLRQSKPGMTTLLNAGANPSQPGLGGDTVLHMAAKANDASYLELLLDHGADPNAPHGVTQAPLIDAALMNPQNDAFELLLAHHADLNRPDRMATHRYMSLRKYTNRNACHPLKLSRTVHMPYPSYVDSKPMYEGQTSF